MSVEGGHTSIGDCQRTSSPRRLRQVHFKELDECLSSLTISDGPKDLPPRPHRSSGNSSPNSPGIDVDEDMPAVKKEKRLKLEVSEEGRASGGACSKPLGRFRTGHGFEQPSSPNLVPRPALCSDIGADPPSPGGPALVRTSFSTPSHTPSISPLSGSSQRESSAGSPLDHDRVSSGSSAADPQADAEGGAGDSGRRGGGRNSLFLRRGRRSPGQLSLKRSRSVHHSSTWTGKREEVLGAEPGTPKLSKCDTL